MKGYKSLMTESTQQRIDTAIKFGAVIAEVCLCVPLTPTPYTMQMDPFATLGFGLAKVTFDVNISPWHSLVIYYLHFSGN